MPKRFFQMFVDTSAILFAYPRIMATLALRELHRGRGAVPRHVLECYCLHHIHG